MHRFADRRAAGRALGERLRATTALGTDLLVLGLPRGGVVVAAEVAATLGAQLDVLVVRKLGLPEQPELAMGAIAATGHDVETVRVASVIAAAGVDEQAFDEVRGRELAELRRREAAYRGNRPAAALSGRAVVLVVAVPVGSPRACEALARVVDELLCLRSPASFRSVGQGYADFGQTSDDEVRAALS
ncbi:MAG: Phosphoribosyltransferase [Blastococcus sp.]|nr:Phosphoribosyltransferase [Blastococcus sp.]